MQNNPILKCAFDVITFVVVFFAIQIVCQLAVSIAYFFLHLEGDASLSSILQGSLSGEAVAASTSISSLLTLLLYTRAKWAPVSKHYLQTRPWGVVCWTVLLAIGSILPLEWLYEQMKLAMPEEAEALFRDIMREPIGYAAIGLLVPLAEELVFRGAVLRVLLNCCGDKRHWVAIALSALIFGVAHLNMAQGTHAFLMGLLLGWLYYRTHSIVPGVIVHWVNNSVAYALFTFFPQMGDGQLIDFFHGSDRALWLGIACSLCVFLPSLYQLTFRLRK